MLTLLQKVRDRDRLLLVGRRIQWQAPVGHDKTVSQFETLCMYPVWLRHFDRYEAKRIIRCLKQSMNAVNIMTLC